MGRELRGNTVRLGDLVARFGGELVGDADCRVNGVAPLEGAGPTEIAFLANPRLHPVAARSAAATILVDPRQAAELRKTGRSLWLADNPYAQFARVSQYFAGASQPPQPGIHASAVVDGSARIHPTSHVAAGAVIGAGAEIHAGVVVGAGVVIGTEVSVGSETRLHARVTVYDNCRIGVRCIIHSGVV